ncbi:CRISPR-associated helicase/endonuclease Cas3 [Paenibacillus sp. IHB B 3415]|uniref:CRISPR-associated helicase/endonuclease Cas3 n=1 Tax=Paenibacillus sp. IHB B 3415 TaxID=867080 RepID=UPI00062E7461|nr:CRISPR-associated helicase/endonuclease Cas3 [Paenibacillus sp. IHB B 3415]
MYYAHSTDTTDKSDWQLLLVHLKEVAVLTAEFAQKFGMDQWGYLAGYLHDLGKYSEEFQRRLEGTSKKVDHATAGAKEIMKFGSNQRMATILSYIIAGHHSGLPDYGTVSGADACLSRRLEKKLKDYSAAFSEIKIPELPVQFSLQPGISASFQMFFLTRMLFSCLVDADTLNTERFASPSQANKRGVAANFPVLLKRFHNHMANRFSKPSKRIDYYRAEIFNECMGKAKLSRGLFSLTLPTGSGKTLVSLGFALEHTVQHPELQRIVYVIPYTSILEQNAAIFREVLGEEVVLEHHSNVQHETDESEEDVDDEKAAHRLRDLRRLSEENWDMPVIVTTNVQFFESLFSHKRSKARKLHNLTNSVIVLDEAQMMNGAFFKPCMYALEELVRNYGCTVIMCTATQPPASGILNNSRGRHEVKVKEIVTQPELRFQQFERVRVSSRGIMSLDSLAGELNNLSQALCIVNTRKTARELFETLQRLQDRPSDAFEGLYHLSARMCPKHRMDILKEVRKRLESGQPCLVISTQLIEAGVDVDFPEVFRELAGLDSIAQAAGRCNRNGKLSHGEVRVYGKVHVFELERGLPKGWMSLTGNLARTILNDSLNKGLDPLSISAVKSYFAELSSFQHIGSTDSTDGKEIIAKIEREGRQLAFPFAEIGREFRMIDEQLEPIIIPYKTDEEKEKGVDEDKTAFSILLNRIRYAPHLSRELLRQLQPYTVQLYVYEYNAFKHAGELTEIREGIRVLERPGTWYSQQTGVKPYSAECAAREIYIL